jgi:hypothetical protein
MSCGSLDASTLPLTWKLRMPPGSSETATEALMPSPTYTYCVPAVSCVGSERPYAIRPGGTPGTSATPTARSAAPAASPATLAATETGASSRVRPAVSRAIAAASPLSTTSARCAPWVPSAGTTTRLNSTAPAIAPTVLAA